MSLTERIATATAQALAPRAASSAVTDTLMAVAAATPMDDDQLVALARVVDASPYLRRHLNARPADGASVTDVPIEDSADATAALRAMVADVSDAELPAALRTARRRAMVAITARELVTGDAIATGRALAAFADACLEVALTRCAATLVPRFGHPLCDDGTPCDAAVIAMGKHGGRELNYSSDIDIIYLYETDAGRTNGGEGLGRSIELHAYFSRLFKDVTQLLSAVTADGFVFRVDLGLRPEGRSGPICNSVAGLERYYEAFGHPWERLAWLKARHAAGSATLGQGMIASLTPFVYRRAIGPEVLDEVAAMKARIDARASRLSGKRGFDVKLGHGGIREVEFAVQALQLLGGGRDHSLRVRDTLGALQRLTLAGRLASQEAEQLGDAYRLLRRLEHLVQLEEDRQTHVIRDEPAVRLRLAWWVGRGDDARARLDDFERRLADTCSLVRRYFDQIVSGGEAAPDPTWEDAFLVSLDLDAAEDERLEALADLGLDQRIANLERIDLLTRRPESPFHPRHLARRSRLARSLMRAIGACADPDQALVHTESLIRRVRHRPAILDQLEADPQRLRRLIELFGASRMLARVLLRSPGLLDRLVLDGNEATVKSRAALERTLAEEPGAAGDWEDVLGATRRFHAAETLRIGFCDLAGALDARGVAEQLTLTAEVIVCHIVAAATADVGRRRGVDASGLGVIGLGKLAGAELGFGSDLDLVFAYPDGAEHAVMTRVARAVMTGLSCATPEGRLYAIDTRLRPSGAQGPLCVSASSLKDYHRDTAELWETQAVLRSRAICGGSAIEELVDGLRRRSLGRYADAREQALHGVAAMRDRLAEEASGPADLKRAPGGLVDLEFAVQALQLVGDINANDPCGSPSATVAIEGFAAAETVPAELARAAASGYRFIRQLENRLALVQDSPGAPRALASLGKVARTLGFGDEPAAALMAALDAHRAPLRELYDHVIGS